MDFRDGIEEFKHKVLHEIQQYRDAAIYGMIDMLLTVVIYEACITDTWELRDWALRTLSRSVLLSGQYSSVYMSSFVKLNTQTDYLVDTSQNPALMEYLVDIFDEDVPVDSDHDFPIDFREFLETDILLLAERNRINTELERLELSGSLSSINSPLIRRRSSEFLARRPSRYTPITEIPPHIGYYSSHGQPADQHGSNDKVTIDTSLVSDGLRRSTKDRKYFYLP